VQSTKCQRGHLKDDPFWNAKPVEANQCIGDVFRSPHVEDEPGCSILNGLCRRWMRLAGKLISRLLQYSSRLRTSATTSIRHTEMHKLHSAQRVLQTHTMMVWISEFNVQLKVLQVGHTTQ